MSIISGTAHSSGDSGFYGFEIGQSLRFDGSSYLSRTSNSSSTDNDKYTMSMWIKKTTISSTETYLSAGAGGTGNFGTFFGTDFHQSSKLSFTAYYGSTTPWYVSSACIQRDTSSWYHYVVVMDQQNSTLSSRIKIYINGVLDSLTVGGYPDTTHTSEINEPSTIHNIGRRSAAQDAHFTGYLAEINFIDGTALTPTSFGETKNGVWIPKDPSGLTYGTNGFRLTFENGIETIGGVANQIRDESSNSNHWTKH